MKFKKIFLFMFLIITLFSIASVCASEVNDTTISASDAGDNLEINDNNLIADDSLSESQNNNLEVSNDDLSGNLKEGNDSNSSKKNITVDVSASDNIVIDTPVTFDANLNESVSGDVVFTINGVDYTVAIVNSTVATYQYTPRDTTNLFVIATFLGNNEYNMNSSSAKIFEVNKISTNIVVDEILPVTYGSDVSIVFNVDASINSTAILEIDGKKYYVALIGGRGEFNASRLNAGNHDITVVFEGDNKYEGCAHVTNFTVVKANLTANVIALNVTVAQNTSFAINVPDDFKGNVSIGADGIELYDGNVKTLINGINLLSGNKTAAVIFYGDDNYNNTILNVDFVVFKVIPTVEVNINNKTYPSDVIVYVNISNHANGTVNVTVGNKIFTGEVYNGTANVVLDHLAAGYKDAEVKFISNDDYNDDVTVFNKFIIYPNNSLITVTNTNLVFKVGEEIDLYFSTTNSTGDIIVYNNGAYHQRLPYEYSRLYDVNFDGLHEGTYNILITLDGDENYTGYSTTTTFTVVKKDLTIDVMNFTETIFVDDKINFTAVLNETVSGDVIFNINGINYTCPVLNSDIATFEYTPLNNATLNVIATFMGNDVYKINSSIPKSFNVTKIPTNVSMSFFNPILSGNDFVITVSLEPEIDGIVYLDFNGKYYNVAVVNGRGMYVVNNVYNATFDIEATFYGDDRYASSSDFKQLFVNKVSTNISVSLNSNIIGFSDVAVVNVVLNQSMNAVATVKVNGANYTVGLVTGKGDLKLYNLSKGNYTINAVYAGNDDYLSCTSTAAFLEVLGKNAPASLSINMNKDSIYVGEKVTVTVNMDPQITGAVKLYVGSDSYDVVVVNGVGTCAISDLANGTYEVKAVFEGDNVHSNNSSNIKYLKVNKIPASLSVNMDKDSISVGDKVTVEIKFNSNITGVVKLYVGSDSYDVVVVGGVGTCAISDLANGTYEVKAVFAGDDKYLSNTSDIKQLKVNCIPTSLFVNIDNSSIFVGDKAVVCVVLNQSINSVVTVKVNNKNYIVGIVNGKGNLTLSDLTYGNYVIGAVFDGNDKYVASQSNIIQLVVSKVSTTLSVGITNASVFVGDNVVVSVNLNQDINDVVSVKVNDKNYTVYLFNGKGNLTLSDLSYGNYTINAIFAGDNKYAQSISNNVTLNVNKINTQLTGNDIVTTYNVNKDLVITLKDINGNPVIGVTVNVDLNGVKSLTTDINGQVKVSTASLAPKTYGTKISFDGNTKYVESSTNVKVVVNKANPVITAKSKTFKVKKTKKYDITLKDNVGKGIKNAVVYLKVNGKTYKATTNANGKATFNLNLKKKGNFKATITYNGNAYYNKSTKNVKINVK